MMIVPEHKSIVTLLLRKLRVLAEALLVEINERLSRTLYLAH
jgi:hypothetical protein